MHNATLNMRKNDTRGAETPRKMCESERAVQALDIHLCHTHAPVGVHNLILLHRAVIRVARGLPPREVDKS